MFDQNGTFTQILNRKQLLNMNIKYDELIRSNESEYWKVINKYRNKFEEDNYKELKSSNDQYETDIQSIENKYIYNNINKDKNNLINKI